MSAGRRAVLPGLAAGLAALAGLHAWRGIEYWNYSEGVYAYTARMLLDGHDIYGEVVAAQPPWQFLAGAVFLAVDDSIGFLRLGVGLLQLGAGVLAGVVVWRLTASRLAAAAAVPLALLTPWAVHEHGALTPETVALPLLLGAVLAAARPAAADRGASGAGRAPAAAGLLASAAVFTKWPFALAALAIALLAPDRRRVLAWLAAGVAVQAAAFTAVFGTGFWTHTVEAQLHSGRRGLDVLRGVWGQAAWNLAGLVAAAGVAVAARGRVRDPALFRLAGGLALALLATVVTNYKQGTGLNILVPVELALLPLALTGAALATGRARALAVAALVFTLVQTASLLTTPRTATPFIYPGSERGSWGRVADEARVEAEERAARACPDGVVFNGQPYFAFVAERPMPGDQPDQFLTRHSKTLSEYVGPMFADTVRCP